MNNADYHSDPAVSASHLHSIAKSPAHYYSRYLAPVKPPSIQTTAMQFGSLVHTAILEPDELAARYGVCPPRNTKAGKEAAEQMKADGIEAITQSDWDTAAAMSDAVYAHPAASELLQQGAPEQSFWWDDNETGLRCKCRPDWLRPDGVVVDLKTTQDASPKGFAKSIANFRYHVQAAHYLNGLEAQRFVFIAVEKTYPFAVGTYELDRVSLDEGQRLAARDLRRIAACRKLDKWPGYSQTISTLTLPAWAFYNDQQEDF